mmetsp:Transcript_33417/g.92481  ORF Transcript_33417/g.92481 Transcript_33417/m.92481 type:complete len:250 (-) Transcript_33417:27-776(-)
MHARNGEVWPLGHRRHAALHAGSGAAGSLPAPRHTGWYPRWRQHGCSGRSYGASASTEGASRWPHLRCHRGGRRKGRAHLRHDTLPGGRPARAAVAGPHAPAAAAGSGRGLDGLPGRDARGGDAHEGAQGGGRGGGRGAEARCGAAASAGVGGLAERAGPAGVLERAPEGVYLEVRVRGASARSGDAREEALPGVVALRHPPSQKSHRAGAAKKRQRLKPRQDALLDSARPSAALRALIVMRARTRKGW